MSTGSTARPAVECTIPILPVKSLALSVEFYRDKLGFQLEWGDPDQNRVCSVARDGRPIMLMPAEQDAPPVWVWIGVEDESVLDEIRQRGTPVVQEPQNHLWAYEMKFADPDGNILWFGTAPRTNEPQLP